jgi:hypothetical protein
MPWGKQVMFTRVVLHSNLVMWLAMAGKARLSIRFGGVCLFIFSPQMSAREYSYSQAKF